MDVKVYYVYHSCFILELKNCYMMFDYYRHFDFESDHDFDFSELINNILKSKKPFYIFASHNHGDHFNMEIFDFDSSNTHYILGDDIRRYKIGDNIHYLEQNSTIKINDVTINTFLSTDIGVSFMVYTTDKVIFHAGDLNWWAWEDDTEQEAEYMEFLFQSAIANIKSLDKQIDIAFFPIDKRLGENYSLGGKYFIEQLNPKMFIPMHFLADIKTSEDFYNEYHNIYSKTNVVKISKVNQEIIYL